MKPIKVNLDTVIEKHSRRLNAQNPRVEYMMKDYERKVLGALVCEYEKGNDVLEFGTWRGLTTAYLAELCLHKTIYTIDLDPNDNQNKNLIQQNEVLPAEEIGMEFKGTYRNVRQILMDSLNFKIEESGIGVLDLALVDGAHDFEHVDSDCKNALKNIRLGGILILHNYNHVNYENVNEENHYDFVEGGPNFYVKSNDFIWKYIENTDFVYTEVLK